MDVFPGFSGLDLFQKAEEAYQIRHDAATTLELYAETVRRIIALEDVTQTFPLYVLDFLKEEVSVSCQANAHFC